MKLAKKSVLNIKKRSVAILFLAAIVVPAIVAIAGLFDLADLSMEAIGILSILTGGFILSEIGIIKLDNARKDPLRTFGIVVGILIILSAALGLFGIESVFFNTFRGILGVGGILYAVSEAVRE